ncbi:bifunctional ADP-dependent NAD(P)H-hydrate dehydratase/NAD(P)H-hydrate epimerase [Candidatus Aerophobetes bacterium]|uniref:Bifunctional NAD(P)H-hydrate repair enzyme n=1 Tax=Aerophobetes bacterium TaxID=2030807 RepID=A0A2A4X4E0_UNCAE|nr:MAG: bifunctional ADP-dependent NAD(P)H-hydrate dehydratase/NAD(P)H-hydrate epimerase [Candidatus Aerophobetes bacterium]
MTTLEGLKVVTAQSMALAEKLSIDQGFSAKSYMLACAKKLVSEVAKFIDSRSLSKRIYLLVGKGNNGGDALAAGTLLIEKGYHVEAFLLFSKATLSPLAAEQLTRFEKSKGIARQITQASQMDFASGSIILDGVFGTGFSGEVKEPVKSCIDRVNSSGLKILSIDIPSGINGNTGEKITSAIYATITFFLALPKTGFFLQEGFNHIGALKCIDFGLESRFIEKIKPTFYLIDREGVEKCFPRIKRDAHKYSAGHVGVIATSPSLEGAGLLASQACYRTGAGLVHLFIPKNVDPLFFASFPEAIITSFGTELVQQLQAVSHLSSLVIGPGLCEKSKSVKLALQEVYAHSDLPLVIDAGGLNILKSSFEKKGSNHRVILTPHKGEMARLLGVDKLKDEGLVETMQMYVEKHNLVLILKGAPTLIFAPGQTPIISTFGTPGMATGGSGDVLSGILGTLLAKGLELRQAAVLGVYIHALAGEIGAEKLSSYSLMASDILSEIPDVIKQIVR